MKFRSALGVGLVAFAVIALFSLINWNSPGVGVASIEANREPALLSSMTTTTTAQQTSTTSVPETTTTTLAATTTTAPPTTTTTAKPTTTTTKTTPATTTTVAPTTTAAPSGSSNSGYEADFEQLINSHRANNGLSALISDSNLDSEARSWSQTMATTGNFEHSDISRFLGPWSSVGENIAYGGSVTSMFNGLVASSGHNANMLGDFTHFGIGVWVDGNGTLWTTHVFTK